MDSIRAYIKEIKNIPLLKMEEEKKLALEVKKGSKPGRRKMIRSNLRLVVNIAKHYSHFGLPLIDLIEEGNIGLMRAVDKFNPRRGFRFSTYASWWIRQAITRAISEQGKLIRVPVYMNERIIKYKKASAELKQKLGREPTIDEIAKKMRTSINKTREITKWIVKTGSLEAPIGDDEEGRVLDLVENTQVVSPDEEVTELLKHEKIKALLTRVSEKERNVINLRFGLYDNTPMTLAQVARKLKVSRERIRQIQDLALLKFKSMLKAEAKEESFL